MRLHLWTGFTTAGSIKSNFDCKNARCWNPLCWHDLGLVALPTALTCRATLFLSFEVREISQTRKWFSIVVIFKVKVARDFYVTKQRIGTSLDVCRLLGCSRRAPSAVLWLLTVACARSALLRRIKLSLRTCRSNSVSFHFTQTFPEKSLSSPIMPCSRAFFNVRNRALPTSNWMTDGRSIDGSGTANRKGPGTTRRSLHCRSLRTSKVFGQLPIAGTSS